MRKWWGQTLAFGSGGALLALCVIDTLSGGYESWLEELWPAIIGLFALGLALRGLAIWRDWLNSRGKA